MDIYCPEFKQFNYRHHFNCIFVNYFENDEKKLLIYNLIKNSFHPLSKNDIDWDNLYTFVKPQCFIEFEEHGIDKTQFKIIANEIHDLFWDEYGKYFVKISSMYNSGFMINKLREDTNKRIKLSEEHTKQRFELSKKHTNELIILLQNQILLLEKQNNTFWCCFRRKK